MAAKVVKTLAVSSIPGGTFAIMGGEIEGGEQAPAIDCSTFSDVRKAKVPHPQPELKAIKIKVAHDGQAMPTVGSVATISITATFTDDSTETNSVAGFISDCSPTMIDVGGERVPAWDIEFTPSGGGVITTTTTTT